MENNDNLPSLDDLRDKIAKSRRDAEESKGSAGKYRGSSLSSGTELIAGVAAGAFLGYYLDQWLNTRPLMIILMIFLGAAGGVLNIYRSGMKTSEDDNHSGE